MIQTRGLKPLRRRQRPAGRSIIEWAFKNMKFKLLFLGLLALATPVTSFAETAHYGASIPLKDVVILIIRHAEAPERGDRLSSAGEARAKAYVPYFKTFTIGGQPLKLDYLFAAKDSAASIRPRLTLEPTADALGLQIDARFKNKHVLQLADEIRSRSHGADILICWHHGEIPRLLSALGADPKTLIPNGKWPNNVFDWVIELRYDADGTLFESRRIDEHMSFDDSAKRTPPTAGKTHFRYQAPAL